MNGPRVHYVDWLRFLAVLAVVAYHALLPFGGFMPWHIENDVQSQALGFVTALLPFAFPVFFLLAGAGAERALRTRSLRAFLAERAARLIVPFIVGTLLLTPITGYLIAVANQPSAPPIASFLASYPATLFDYSAATSGLSPMVFQTFGMHLWFLAWLFLWCLIAAPAIAWLSSPGGARAVERLASWSRVPGTSLLFAVPLYLVALPLFRVSAPTGWDWAVFGLWGSTFVGGYLLFRDDRLLAAVRRDLLPALVAAAVGISGLAASGFTDSIFRGGAHTSDVFYLVVIACHALAVWGTALSVLSLGMRVRFMQRPLPRRAGEWGLPLYVLHFPIVTAVSALVVRAPLDLWPKAALSVVLGIGLTVVVVAAIVRVTAVRPLLGLRPAAAHRRAAAAS